MLGDSMSKSVVTATTAARAKAQARAKALKGEKNNQAAEAVVPTHANDEAQALAVHDVKSDNTLAGDFSFSAVMGDAAASASMMEATGASFGAATHTFAQDSGGEGGGLFGGDSTPLIIGGVVLVGAGIAIAASGGDDDDSTPTPTPTPTPAANKAPTITAPATVAIAEDAKTTGKITATDPEGDAITFAVTGTAPQGFVLNKDGSYSIDTTGSDYQALKAGETKDYTVTFTATDAKGAASSSTLTYKVTGADEASTATISAAGTSNAATGNITYTVTAGNYVHTITGFSTGDKIISPAGNPGTLENSSFTDGKAVIQYANNGQVTQIELTGLTNTQDAALFGTSDLNTVFGAGTYA